MKLLLVMTIALRLGVEISAYFELNGQLAEQTGLPVNLYCPQKIGYISIGGITVNNVPLTKERQTKAKDQCDTQIEKYDKYRTDPSKAPNGTQCVLTLPGAKINDNDVIRMLFKCHDQQPIGDPIWGEEKGTEKPVEDKKDNATKDAIVILTCNKKNEIITITEILLDGEAPDTDTHPDLFPQIMTDKCFDKWLTVLKGQENNYEPSCTIINIYGDILDITYVCLGPGQKSKVIQNNKTGKKQNDEHDKDEHDKDEHDKDEHDKDEHDKDEHDKYKHAKHMMMTKINTKNTP